MSTNRFLTYLKPQPPRFMPKTDLFLRFIDIKKKDAIHRSLHTLSNSQGVRVLTEIIKLLNLKETLPLYFERKILFEDLLRIEKDLEQPIDTRVGRQSRSLFIHTKSICFEMILPSRRSPIQLSSLFYRPYNTPEWDLIRPFRIYDMSDCDLVYTAHMAQLYYIHNAPKYVLYTLDCLALVCKFLAYFESHPNFEDIDSVLQDFLHIEVVIPTLINDSSALWMRNIYRSQFMSVSPLKSLSMTLWDNINGDTLGSDFTAAMYDVHHLRTDVINGSVTPLVALSSLNLSRDISFTKYYTDLLSHHRGSSDSTQLWAEILKNLSWMEFIILTNSISGYLPEVQSFERDVIRDIRVWMMAKPWNSIHSSLPYKSMVETRIRALYTYLQSR